MLERLIVLVGAIVIETGNKLIRLQGECWWVVGIRGPVNLY